jgi:F-type H+-transporting ATPase subunit b
VAFAEGASGLLSPDGSILVIFLIFIALVPALNRIVFKPVSRVLDERDRLTTGSDTDVRAIMGTIDDSLARYEEGVRDARAEGYRLLEARRAEVMAERQAAIEGARAEANGRIDAGREEIARDAEAARARLDAEAREIARTISASVLGRAVGGLR